MLKPADPGPGGPDPDKGKKIGDLVGQIVEDGKAYAQAELNVAKALVQDKIEGLKVPALLGLFAFLFLQAGVLLLGLTVYATLVSRLGPLLAGLISVLLFAAIAGGLGWYAAKRVKDLG
ncbi:MAG TPA: phage holin family protein [Sphingomicrobium sp.]|jgi:hypothetical protein|nr:phage holin family protein [Sphingomicrobium sp.]